MRISRKDAEECAKTSLILCGFASPFASLRETLLLLLSALLLVTCPTLVRSQEGDVRQVHDPSIIREAGTYYLFSTRAGIAIRCSKDLVHWRLCGDVFAHLPEWAVKDVPGLRGLWAPDISYFNGKYHLYYSVSTFGSNHSRIGLVTNQTLDPASDKYRWMDQGSVIGSEAVDDWNAIDPNVVFGERAGQPFSPRSTSLPTGKPQQTRRNRSSQHHPEERLLLPLRLIRLLLSWKRQHLQHSCRPRAKPHWSIHRSQRQTHDGRRRHARRSGRRPVGGSGTQCGLTGEERRLSHLSRLRY